MLLVAGALLLVAAPSSRAWADQEADRSQIKKLTEQIIDAQLKGDASALDALLADDYVSIRSDGVAQDKAQELAAFRSGANRFEKIEIREWRIRVYGDSGITSLLISFSGTLHGKPVNSEVRTTRLWVRQQGAWKAVLFQATRPPAKVGS